MFIFIIMPRPNRMGHNASMAIVCLVCLSCAWPESRMEGCSKRKIGRKKASWHWWPVTPFRGQKVKVTRLLNALTCVFYRNVNVQWTISALWSPSWKFWVAVCHHLWGRGIMWRLHYRLYSLFCNISVLLRWWCNLFAVALWLRWQTLTVVNQVQFYFC